MSPEPYPINSTRIECQLIASINQANRHKQARQQQESLSKAPVAAAAPVSKEGNGTIEQTNLTAVAVSQNGFSLSLFDIEEGLQAFLDTAEVVSADQEQAFLVDFEHALNAATEKRDRVAGMLANFEAREAFCKLEIDRLKELKASSARKREQLEAYVSYVIQRIGKDAKGKYRKLEGRTSVLSLAACPVSVEVTDEPAIPLEYKRATLTVAAALLNDVMDALDDKLQMEFAKGMSLDLAVDKGSVKAAIEAKVNVPGARLVTDKTSLRRK